MFFRSAEVHVQIVQMLQERSERCALSHLRKGVDILLEVLAAVAELAIETAHVGVRVVVVFQPVF